MSDAITWLHISDLHAGMYAHEWLWPRFKSQFFKDIRQLHKKTGSWDVVIFSGDFVQSAIPGEYDLVAQMLEELWSVHAELGFNPKLLVVPGNHDLMRPPADEPPVMLLKKWWTEEEVRIAMFDKPQGPFRKVVDEAFANYSAWLATIESSAVPLMRGDKGLMPGDFSATVEVDGKKFGFVGLNSAWLQLAGGDYHAKLAVDLRQLLSVTKNDPDQWAKGHDATVLITHHPTDWLHPDSVSTWSSEIDPPGRFDAHLYGHMHVADAISTAHGGSQARRGIQAASLFGLEKFSDLSIDRSHGYSVAKLSLDGTIQVWPRIATLTTSGARRMVPDHSLDLDDSEAYLIHNPRASGALKRKSGRDIVPAPAQSKSKILDFTTMGSEVLERLRYFIPPLNAHQKVRRIEQRLIIGALSDVRGAWLVADWGSGSDGFIRSVQEAIGDKRVETYKIECGDYVSRSEFLDSFKSRIGVSLEQLCGALADHGSAYLVLDNAPTRSASSSPGAQLPEDDIEDIAKAILAFCPALRILIRTRRVPDRRAFPVVPLKPLDEADVRAYVLDHEHGGTEYMNSESISIIYRHTDGVPARIDTTLRELEIIPLGQLSSTDSELVRVDSHHADVPPALISAVSSLEESEEPIKKRSLELLRALSAFPQGESLERLKRFYGVHPIHPTHARELLDNSLIATFAPPGGAVAPASPGEKLLQVPRPVRDYVRSRMSGDDLSDVSRRAATVYFGEHWELGTIKSSMLSRLRSAEVKPHELSNSSSIIIRLMNDAVDLQSERSFESAIEISKAYLVAIFDGDHYRSVVTLAKDLLAILPEGYESAKAFFTYELARAMRMTGDDRDARDMMNTVDTTQISARMKRSLLVSLAMAHQGIGESDDAIRYAKEVIKSDKHSNSALQAKAIILEESESTTPQELLALENLCRKKDAHVVANNLALSRADKAGAKSAEIDMALDDVMKHAKSNTDYYNNARAIVARVKKALAENSPISDDEKSLLIDSYHFLYSERLAVIFDKCHDVLWNLFERYDEQENLLRLFRHSSLIWRLRGREEKEKVYLRKLAEKVHAIAMRNPDRVNREAAYYLVRSSALLT